MAHEAILELRNVSKSFRAPGEGSILRPQYTHAVSDVSFRVYPGETFGLVGESGCGKSTVAKLIMGLEKPDEGEILYRGQRIDNLSEKDRRSQRTRCQMVFQDSGSSLNPRKRVEDILLEPMLHHQVADKRDLPARIDKLLDMVGLPREVRSRYPHEFSGGQRQRICLAKALSLDPELIILDEPVSALDVSVQAQILNLLKDLQQELNLTYVFIGHGLGAVKYVSHRIAVMYMGQVVEVGDAQTLFDRPVHPYTKALLDAAPVADFTQRNRERATLKGEITRTAGSGCVLMDRCPMATAACGQLHPSLTPVPGRTGYEAACLRAMNHAGKERA